MDPAVEALRVEGNEHFKKGDFAAALKAYGAAIELAPVNHLLYSNRSLAHHSNGDFPAAEADARKCLELAPQFIKGFYRLANAQTGAKDYDAAEATIKSGLAKDGENPELKKLWRIVKGKRDKDRRAALPKPAGGSARAPDAESRAEAERLGGALQKNGRELQETHARLNACKREIQRTTITRDEIKALPEDSTVYRSVGKMFLASDPPKIDALLGDQLGRGEERASQLAARAQFLDRRVKEQQAELTSLVRGA